MNLADKLIYSNIQEYRIGDSECENLTLKALHCGIKTIVIGPSALDTVHHVLGTEESIKVNVAVSYPSGAYTTETKIQEIEGLLELDKRIDGFYAVMQVGAYLSGRKEEVYKEMRDIVQAAKGIPISLITEIGVMRNEQIEEVCKMAIDSGIYGLVTSAGFLPYEVPFADEEAYKTAIKAGGQDLQII
ncbi:MAG: hypothetical protein RR614_05115, partial [Eubacterium sp.]